MVAQRNLSGGRSATPFVGTALSPPPAALGAPAASPVSIAPWSDESVCVRPLKACAAGTSHIVTILDSPPTTSCSHALSSDTDSVVVHCVSKRCSTDMPMASSENESANSITCVCLPHTARRVPPPARAMPSIALPVNVRSVCSSRFEWMWYTTSLPVIVPTIRRAKWPEPQITVDVIWPSHVNSHTRVPVWTSHTIAFLFIAPAAKSFASLESTTLVTVSPSPRESLAAPYIRSGMGDMSVFGLTFEWAVRLPLRRPVMGLCDRLLVSRLVRFEALSGDCLANTLTDF